MSCHRHPNMVGHKCCGMRGPGMKGPGSFMFEEIQQLMIGTISELSEKYVDDGSANMKTHSMRSLIMKYQINRDNLHQTLRPKVVALFN